MKEDLYLRQLLYEQPTPPRNLKLFEVYRREFKKTGVFISGLSGILGICGISIFVINHSFELDLTEWILLAVFMLISAIAFAAAGAGPFMRHTILRNGIVTNGEIVEVGYIEGSAATLAAMRNGGIAVAKILVQNGDKNFISEWEFDGSLWSEVKKGSQLRLLIHPNKFIVTDILGIIETTKPDAIT